MRSIRTETHKAIQLTGTLLTLGTLALSACGKGNQEVTVSSSAFNTSGEATSARENVLAVAPATDVTDFKFCVKRVQLINEDGESIKKEDETGDNDETNPEDIRFEPGLIDVSAGTEVDWGKANIPTGFKLSKLKIKVKKDQALCGTDYSLSFNGQTTPQDIEFRWKFEPAIDLSESTEKLSLSLAEVVAELRQAADEEGEGHIASLKDRIEKIEGKAE